MSFMRPSQVWSRDLTGDQLRRMFLDFFVARDHAEIPSASLIPDGDGSVLFTTAGMHPLVPYLMGQSHPAGTRLTNCQKCVRTNDLEEVGDLTHLTFFEMLGNWSLGDFYKDQAIAWSYAFLTDPKYLGIPPDLLWVTCFKGDANIPRDEEAATAWLNVGIPEKRIYFLGAEDNWWAAGPEGPCGPDTEIFFDMTGKPCGRCINPGPGSCECGRFFEIWNNVFMSYDRQGDHVTDLPKCNVDTGMGLERTLAALNAVESVYETSALRPIMDPLIGLSPYNREQIYADSRLLHACRIITDHLRTAVFIIGDEQGVKPSNQQQGYVLRRLIRRAVRYCGELGIAPRAWVEQCDKVVDLYGHHYAELNKNRDLIRYELLLEQGRFEKTLTHGKRMLDKEIARLDGVLTLPGAVAFHLYDTYGFPIEFTQEIAEESGVEVDHEGFATAFTEHREKSRSLAAKSGLADDSQEAVRYHTATHLLHAALRQVLGTHVEQRGSNINRERMRFDFSHPQAMTSEEKTSVQALVQEWIMADIPVDRDEMTIEAARSIGAIGLFSDKYGDKVSVYRVGDVSLEFCGGPHVERTSEIGGFKIDKEQSSAAGIRRIRASLR